jgi:hypothetical protein
MEYRSSIPERKSPDFPHDFQPTSCSFLPETVGNYRKNPKISVSEYGIYALLISDVFLKVQLLLPHLSIRLR